MLTSDRLPNTKKTAEVEPEIGKVLRLMPVWPLPWCGQKMDILEQLACCWTFSYSSCLIFSLHVPSALLVYVHVLKSIVIIISSEQNSKILIHVPKHAKVASSGDCNQKNGVIPRSAATQRAHFRSCHTHAAELASDFFFLSFREARIGIPVTFFEESGAVCRASVGCWCSAGDIF